MSCQVLYSKVDAVVIPSRSEGFGYVALEAMKYSKAIIASRRGALPELVVDKYSGYLFNINNKKRIKANNFEFIKREFASHGWVWK